MKTRPANLQQFRITARTPHQITINKTIGAHSRELALSQFRLMHKGVTIVAIVELGRKDEL